MATTRSAALWLMIVAGCDGGKVEDSQAEFAGPILAHTPPASGTEGADLALSVTAEDPEGVRAVTLYWRAGGGAWTQAAMTAPGEAGDPAWAALIPGDEVRGPSVDYYFKATDGGDPAASSYLPAEQDDAPFSVPISVQGVALPWIQGFEEINSIVEVDMHAASAGARGYGWEVAFGEGQEGEQSVWHPRGNADVGRMQDWLISPPLDLSGTPQVQVTWQERGASIDQIDHRLLIAVGDSDPTDGGYEEVAVLPAPPEGAWGRSAVYDLSAWAGNPTVYLAWYFEGEDADDWYMDDIRVEALRADLGIAFEVAADPLSPGDTTALTVQLSNATSVAAQDLTVAVSFPEGGASASAPATGISVTGGGTASALFDLSVDADAVDNRYLPIRIDVTGADPDTDAWAYEGRLLVGEASVATVEVTPQTPALLTLSIGAGDPDSPAVEIPIYSGTLSAATTFTEDITGYGDLLPPAPGPARWFLRVAGQGTTTVERFAIAYDGAEVETGPAIAYVDQEKIVYLPEPPDLALLSASPRSTLAPGSSAVPVSVTVRNTGAATSGPLTAELIPLDADLTVQTGPVQLSAGIVARGGSASLTDAFVIDVSAAHDDSTDLAATLRLTDGADTWELPVSFAVPWPVLQVTRVEIDDAGGDGILDPGEAATVNLEITNVGALSCDGTVRTVASLDPASTALATVDPAQETLGTLSTRATRDGDFALTVDPAATAGQAVRLLLTSTDSSRTYLTTVEIPLVEPPWSYVNSLNDPAGDALNGWQFDLMNVQYRAWQGYLQLRFISYTPYDPATLFVEAWGTSPGAQFSYYQIALQSGIASARTYDGSFHDLGAVAFSYPDAYTVQLDVEIALLGLALDQISLGFASGWCGNPDYCDQFPDGWGYAYTGWSPSLWYDLSW